MSTSPPPDRIIRDLAEVYHLVELDLLDALAAAVRRGADTDDLTAQAVEATKIRMRAQRAAASLDAQSAALVGQVAQDTLEHAERGAAAELALLLGGVAADYRSPIPRRRLDALARSLSDTLTPAHRAVTRVVADAYKQIIGRVAGSALTGALTRRQVAQRALDEFARQGVTGFTDRAGRQWSLTAYAEMALRTGTARAATDGHLDKLAGQGIDLVYVSDSPRECSLCRPFEGKILSLFGSAGTVQVRSLTSDELVPVEVMTTVQAARLAGLLHPNCTHSLSAYLPGATRLPTDTANPQGYEERQKLRALERQVRAAKRAEQVALDPTALKAAKARTRAAQARIRDHVDTTGLLRQRHREQVGRAI